MNSEVGARRDTSTEPRCSSTVFLLLTLDIAHHDNVAAGWENLSGQLSARSEGALSIPA